MPRPRSKKVVVNLTFSSLIREGATSLDSMLVDQLKALQATLGSFAVEDMLKGLVRDAYKAGWPNSSVQTQVVVKQDDLAANSQLDDNESESDDLELEIPDFLQVTLS